MGRHLTFVLTCVVALCLAAGVLVGCAQRGVDLTKLPEGFPEITVEGKSQIPGTFLTSANGAAGYFLLEFDEAGEVVWCRQTGEPNDAALGWAVNFQEVDAGSVRYFYFEKQRQVASYEANSDLVLLDESRNEINRVRYIRTDDQATAEASHYAVDPHGAIVLGRDSYIVVTSRNQDVSNVPSEANIQDNRSAGVTYIQEVENGKVKWVFDSSAYPQFYTYAMDHTTELDHFREDYSDYMHFNAMAIDPADGNLLVSFRNQCSIVKLDRETGEPLWILGGKGDQFNLSEDARFMCQHAISFTDEGNLLMYDNGIEGSESRILELRLDQHAMQAEVVQSIPLGVDTTNWGFVQKLDANIYLVNEGQTPNLDASTGFYELDAKTGEKAFAVSFGEGPASYWVHKAS